MIRRRDFFGVGAGAAATIADAECGASSLIAEDSLVGGAARKGRSGEAGGD